MGRIDATSDLSYAPVFVRAIFLDHRAREPRQVALEQLVHGDGGHVLVAELADARVPLGPEEGTLLYVRLLDVFADRLGRGEMKPDPSVLVALLVERDRRLVPVLVE